MKSVAEETSENFRKKCLFEAGLSFSAGAVLPLAASLLLSVVCALAFPKSNAYEHTDWYAYLGYLLPQLCLAATAVIYFYRSKEPVRALLPACKWYYFPIAIIMQFGLLFPLSELNGLFISLLQKLGYRESLGALPTLTGWNLLPDVLVIAVLPAIFEETLFRGIISRNLHADGWGAVSVVFTVGAMFSLFHGNPSQTLYQFVCGVCLTLVAVKSGSVYPTMVAHFLNNAAILTLESTGYGTAWQMSLGAYIAVQVVASLCLLGSVAFLVFFRRRDFQKGKPVHGKKFAFGAIAGIAVCAIQWLVLLVVGFLPPRAQ